MDLSANQQNMWSEGTEIGGEDALRANFYGLLARVLAKPMDDATLESMRTLADHDDSTPLGNAIASFGKLCLRTPHAKAEAEFSELFYGVGAGGELSPYASIYVTGLVYDKPLAELRGDMAVLGIATSDGNSEPEDHIASLCEMMHGLLTGAFGGDVVVLKPRCFSISTWRRGRISFSKTSKGRSPLHFICRWDHRPLVHGDRARGFRNGGLAIGRNSLGTEITCRMRG